MKFTNIMAALLCGLCFVACDYESFEEESALGDLQTGNAFVRLITGGVAGTEDVVVGEESTSADVTIESSSVRGGDVTVEYSLGGTAEYGTIYTIEGASQSGGNLLIPFQESVDNTAPARADITINFMVDTLMAVDQTIELSLVSATSSDSESLDVGQGPLRQSLTINLLND